MLFSFSLHSFLIQTFVMSTIMKINELPPKSLSYDHYIFQDETLSNNMKNCDIILQYLSSYDSSVFVYCALLHFFNAIIL